MEVARRRDIANAVLDKVVDAIAYPFKVTPFNIVVVTSRVSGSSSQVVDPPAPVTPELPVISAAAYAGELASHGSAPSVVCTSMEAAGIPQRCL